MQAAPQRETVVGVWRGSKSHLGFWLRSIFSLSLWYFLVYKQNSITLTTRRLTQTRGNILTRNETSIDLSKISNIVVNRSALGSLLGYGDIVVESAGTDSSEISFVGMERPEKLRDAVFDLQDGKLDETAE